MGDRDTAFAEYFASRSTAMRASAYLLCGDWHRAEDLVQAAFVKLYLAWNRLEGHDKLDVYTRKVLVRTFLDERKAGWFRRTRVVDEPPDPTIGPDTSIDDRLMLVKALRRLPPRQRATLILRYWEDLSVEETAQSLGCSTGTVKSQAARGLEALRGVLPASLAITNGEGTP